MPLDPSISLGFRLPQVDSPLTQYGQAMTLRQHMLQGDVMERGIADDAALRQVLSQSGGDLGTAQKDLIARGLYKPAMEIGKAQREQRVQDTTIAKNVAEAEKTRIANQRERLVPVNDQAGYENWLRSIVAEDGMQHAQALPQQFTPEVKANLIMKADQAVERISPKAHFADTGGAVQPVNPYTGAPQGAALPKTVSPDAQLRADVTREGQKLVNDRNTAATLDADAIEQAAGRYAIDGTLPPNLGRGTQGSLNTAAILKRAAEIAKESGNAPEAARVNQIANRASQQALGQLVKQKNLIVSFEKTAARNADLVLSESEKVDRLGVPAIDRWIQAGMKNIAGDVDVARLDTAVRTFVNEYARVTTSVTGGGITSDTARREIETLLRAAHTKEQVKGVVDLMKQEMLNRKLAYEDQEKELKSSITTGRAPEPSGAAPAAVTPSPQPATPQYPTATAPNGRKVIFKDGKWQNLQP